MFNIYKKGSSTTTSWISLSSSGSEMTAGKRRAAGGVFTGLTPPAHAVNGSRKLFFAVALFVLLAGVNCAADQKTVKPSPTSPLTSSSASLSATPHDEIYIDDESIEGSGGRGGLHDDLEKDPDYSGSGFGPDDEDSSTDIQQSHRGINSQTQSGKHNTNANNNDDNDDLITSRTHHQTNSGTIIGSNSGSNSGILGGNSGSNTGLNTIGSVAHPDDEDFDLGEGDEDEKQQLGGGSGDGGFIVHTDDDDDHTGDVDEDDREDLVERPHQRQHELDAAAAGAGYKPQSSNVDNSSSTSSTTSTTTTGSSSSGRNSDSKDRKKILSANADEDDEHVAEHEEDEDDDEFDDTYDEDHKDDDEDEDDDANAHEEDDNTELYIDATEPNAKGGSVSQDNERGNTNQGNTIHELDTNNINSQPTDTKVIEHTTGNEVLIMNTSDDDRTASFFAQPGILAAVIGGAVVGLLCAILVVMFIVYRMRKKDEGSYALDEPKRSPAVNSYAKNANNREFYA